MGTEYIVFEKWLSRCNTCAKRKECLMGEVVLNQKGQADCYVKDEVIGNHAGGGNGV